MKNPKDFFFIQGEVSPSEGGALLPRISFTPELAMAVIETQGSKATPKGTLLSEIEQKSKRFFIAELLMLDGTCYTSIPNSFND